MAALLRYNLFAPSALNVVKLLGEYRQHSEVAGIVSDTHGGMMLRIIGIAAVTLMVAACSDKEVPTENKFCAMVLENWMHQYKNSVDIIKLSEPERNDRSVSASVTGQDRKYQNEYTASCAFVHVGEHLTLDQWTLQTSDPAFSAATPKPMGGLDGGLDLTTLGMVIPRITIKVPGYSETSAGNALLQ